MARAAITAGWALCAWLAVLAGPAQERKPVFRAGASLVLTPFHVIRERQFVRKLAAGDVIVLEDGRPREFSLHGAGTNFDIMLLFDVGSGTEISVVPEVSVLKTSILDRLPEARIAVYAYDNLLMPLCGPTRDLAELKGALENVIHRAPDARLMSGRLMVPPPAGSIELQRPGDALERSPDSMPLLRIGDSLHYPAVNAALRTLSDWPGDSDRAILVFSSGRHAGLAFWLDRLGLATFPVKPEDAAALALQLGIPLYPFVVKDRPYFNRMAKKNAIWAEEVERQHGVLRDLGEATGGLAFDVAPDSLTLAATRQIFLNAAEHLASRYIAAFQPASSDREPRRHRIEVRLRSAEIGTVEGGVRMVVY